MTPTIMVLNAGSSSVRFAAFELCGADLHRLFNGSFERLGTAPHFIVQDEKHVLMEERHLSPTEFPNQEAAVEALFAWFQECHSEIEPVAIGHRVVHGGPEYAAPVVVNHDVLAALREF
jgi:acetate kinase